MFYWNLWAYLSYLVLEELSRCFWGTIRSGLKWWGQRNLSDFSSAPARNGGGSMGTSFLQAKLLFPLWGKGYDWNPTCIVKCRKVYSFECLYPACLLNRSSKWYTKSFPPQCYPHNRPVARIFPGCGTAGPKGVRGRRGKLQGSSPPPARAAEASHERGLACAGLLLHVSQQTPPAPSAAHRLAHSFCSA